MQLPGKQSDIAHPPSPLASALVPSINQVFLHRDGPSQNVADRKQFPALLSNNRRFLNYLRQNKKMDLKATRYTTPFRIHNSQVI
jgi:hypothetical protein